MKLKNNLIVFGASILSFFLLKTGVTEEHSFFATEYPLHYAIKTKKRDATEDFRRMTDFIEKNQYNLDQLDENSHTPLMVALLNKDIKTFDNLLKLGADPNKENQDGDVILHFAADGKMTYHSPSYVEVLLNPLLFGKKIDINKQNKQGNTPLHTAASTDHASAYNLLLLHGADDRIKNKNGETVFNILQVQREDFTQKLKK